MRPKELRLRNIGPFTGEHCIHFDELGSLFLIYGQTGAGKTTIFDALSYTFYGKPLGGRAGIPRNLRSHFADEYAVADVTLTFYIGSDLYRIKRQLPYTKEGRKTENPEEVLFEQYKDGTWENRSSTNKRETDAAVQRLIKLSDKEFGRIVLLPQGEFAQFLRAQSSEKKETLMHLFPVSRYTGLMQAAKARSDALQQEVAGLEAALKNLHTQFVYHRYESDRAELLEQINRIRTEHGTVLEDLKTKNTQLEQEKILWKKRQELAQVQEEIEAYRIREGTIFELKTKIERAQRALPLAVHAGQLRELEAACDAGLQTGMEKRQRIAELSEHYSGLLNKRHDIEAKEQQRDSLYSVLDSLRKAAVLEQEIREDHAEEAALKETAAAAEEYLHRLQTDIESLSAKTAALLPEINALEEREQQYRGLQIRLDIEKQLVELLRKQEQLNVFLRSHTQAAQNAGAKLTEITRDLEIQTEQLARIEEEKDAAARQRTAAALAVLLHEGSPCPVCGSLHHPNPAHRETESAFGFDERIAAAKRAIQQLQKEKERIHSSRAAAETAQGNYQAQLDECAAAAEDLRQRYASCTEKQADEPLPGDKKTAELRLAETARQIEQAAQVCNTSRKAFNEHKILEEKLRRLRPQEQEAVQVFRRAETELSALSSAVQEKQRQLDRAFSLIPEPQRSGDAESALEQCTVLLQELKLTINAYHTNSAETAQNLERMRGELAVAEQHTQKQQQQCREKAVFVEAACKKEGFTDVEDLQQALCDEWEIVQWQTEIGFFYEQYTAYKQTAAGLEKELAHTVPQDIEALEAAAEQLSKRYDEIQSRLEVLNADKAKLEELHAQHTALTEELTAKTAEAKDWISLSKDLSGSNPRKLQFDTWILSAFLHEVTVFANKRLERMSEGRYRLSVSEEQGSGNNYKGLDLEIADAYTGKCRPSATLSGGETFMASISLALGLADSIQARAGGIRIDSMFIDEGFGSLDEKALENAIGILDEIRGDRMVGIISHVGELQSRIPQKIEVVKTGTGSSIRCRR